MSTISPVCRTDRVAEACSAWLCVMIELARPCSTVRILLSVADMVEYHAFAGLVKGAGAVTVKLPLFAALLLRACSSMAEAWSTGGPATVSL